MLIWSLLLKYLSSSIYLMLTNADCRPAKDLYYDYDLEQREVEKEQEKKKLQARQSKYYHP